METTQLPFMNGNDHSWTFPNISESIPDSSSRSLSHVANLSQKNESWIYSNKKTSWTDVDGAWDQFVKECTSGKSSFLMEAAHEDHHKECFGSPTSIAGMDVSPMASPVKQQHPSSLQLPDLEELSLKTEDIPLSSPRGVNTNHSYNDLYSLCESIDHIDNTCDDPRHMNQEALSLPSSTISPSRLETPPSSHSNPGELTIVTFDSSPVASPLTSPLARLFDEEFASPLGPSVASSPVSSYGFISLVEYQSIVDQANQPSTSSTSLCRSTHLADSAISKQFLIPLSPSLQSEMVVDHDQNHDNNHDGVPDISPCLSPRSSGNYIPFSSSLSPRRNALIVPPSPLQELLPSIEYLQQEAKLEKLTAAAAAAAVLSTIVESELRNDAVLRAWARKRQSLEAPGNHSTTPSADNPAVTSEHGTAATSPYKGSVSAIASSISRYFNGMSLSFSAPSPSHGRKTKLSTSSMDLTALSSGKNRDSEMDRQVSPTVRIKGGGGTQSPRHNDKNPSFRIPGSNVASSKHGSPMVFDVPPFQDLRVLIVDESKKFVKHSTKHLQSLGCVVTEAKGCKQALRLLTTENFDVAIIDFMPVTYQGEPIRERWPFPLPAHLKFISESDMTPVLLGVELMARFTQLQEQQAAQEEGVSYQQDIVTHYPFGSQRSGPSKSSQPRLRSLEPLNSSMIIIGTAEPYAGCCNDLEQVIAYHSGMHFFVPKPMQKDMLYAVLHLKTRAWDVVSQGDKGQSEGEDIRHVLAALKIGRARDGVNAYRQRDVQAAVTRQVAVVGVNDDSDEIVGDTATTMTVSKPLSRQNAIDKTDADADADLRLSLCPSASMSPTVQETLSISNPSLHVPLPLEDVYLVDSIVCRSSFDGVLSHNDDHGVPAAGTTEAAAVSLTMVESHKKRQGQDQDQSKEMDKGGRVVLSQRRKQLRLDIHLPTCTSTSDVNPDVCTTTVNDTVTVIGSNHEHDSDITVIDPHHTSLAHAPIDIDALADLRIRAKPGATSLASHFANVHGGYHPSHQPLENNNDDHYHHSDHDHHTQQDLEASPGPGPGLGVVECDEGCDGDGEHTSSGHRGVFVDHRNRGDVDGKGHSFVSARHIRGTGSNAGGHDKSGHCHDGVVGVSGGGGVGGGFVHPATPRSISRPSSFTDVGARHQGGSMVVVAGKGMVLAVGAGSGKFVKDKGYRVQPPSPAVMNRVSAGTVVPFAEATTTPHTTTTAPTTTDSRQDIYGHYGIRSSCSKDASASATLPISALPPSSTPAYSLSSEKSDDSGHTSVESLGSKAQRPGLGKSHTRRFEYGESSSSSRSTLSFDKMSEDDGRTAPRGRTESRRFEYGEASSSFSSSKSIVSSM